MPLRAGGLLQHRGKTVLIAVFLLSVYAFLRPQSNLVSTSRLAQSWAPHWLQKSGESYLNVQSTSKQHPVEVLVQDAESRYKEQRSKRSTSLAEAIAEYQRRYGREPPPKFDVWHSMAVERNCTIIDDYDVIFDSLEPFWALSAAELLKRVEMVIKSKDWLTIYEVKDHKVEGKTYMDPLKEWLKFFAKHLPDMKVPYNKLAESRIVVPAETLMEGAKTCRDEGKKGDKSEEAAKFADLSHQRTWSHVIKSCPSDALARNEGNASKGDGTDKKVGLRFIKNAAAVKNLCDFPELKDQHGNLISPDTTLLAQELLPLFSRDKLSTFQDILVPTPSYTWQNKAVKREDWVPWEKKENDLYWSGTTTGGYFHDDSWRLTQRFRFVSIMNDHNRSVSFMRRTDNQLWEEYQSTIESISPSVKVKFTKQKLCDKKICEDQKADPTIVFGSRDGYPEFNNHRLLMDIDGQASTDRFYKLLASGSLVIKHSLMREWHEDRLVPWVHYVPVSMDMEELPELTRFFTQDEAGQAIAKKIAAQGQQFWVESLRNDDLMLYYLRLIIEWARLIDPQRDKDLVKCS